MAKLLQFHLLVFLGLTVSCSATLYIVGGTSGWDISSDLDTWSKNKKFVVGDILLFQYSSSYSVMEVTREGYEACNTSSAIQSSSNGNTSFTLTRPGDEYFICDKKLYCLGGMRLHVNVEQSQLASRTAATAAPVQAESGVSLPQTSSKSTNPSSVIPSSSAMLIHGHGGIHSLVFAVMGLMASTLVWAA